MPQAPRLSPASAPPSPVEALVQQALSQRQLSAQAAEQLYQMVRRGGLSRRDQQQVELLRDAIAHQHIQVLSL